MLKLPNLFSRPVAFEPVQIENDELIEAIDADPVTHDNQWSLTDDISANELAAFWDKTLRELKKSNKDQ